MTADPAPDERSRPPLDLVERLHATPHRAVYAFAGAGSMALHWLHAVGGSSRTVLEAHDHYHPTSLEQAIGDAPERAVAPDVAVALATRSLARARALTADDDPPGPTFGLGLTATIATDRRKRGHHRVEVAAADGLGVRRAGVVLEKGARDRAGEEGVAGRLLLVRAAEACGVLGTPDPELRAGERLERGFEPSSSFRRFLADDAAVLSIDADGRLHEGPPSGPSPALVSGSFHPMHAGHRGLALAAEVHLGRPAWFEMSLGNAEKDAIDAADAAARAAQAYGERGVVLSHEPLFSGKAERLPGAIFVLGVDTARRVLQARFYGGDEERAEAMARIRAAGSRFLVAGRAGPDGFRTLEDLEVPEDLADLFEPLPAFRVDLSSTELRAAWPVGADGGDGAGDGDARPADARDRDRS